MAKKEIESVSTTYQHPALLNGFRSYFGRKVLSRSGQNLGHVQDAYLGIY
jgi:hypothetical protein